MWRFCCVRVHTQYAVMGPEKTKDSEGNKYETKNLFHRHHPFFTGWRVGDCSRLRPGMPLGRGTGGGCGGVSGGCFTKLA